MAEVRLVHAQHIHHDLAGDTDLFTNDRLTSLQPALDHAQLNLVSIFNTDLRLTIRQRIDRDT